MGFALNKQMLYKCIMPSITYIVIFSFRFTLSVGSVLWNPCIIVCSIVLHTYKESVTRSEKPNMAVVFLQQHLLRCDFCSVHDFEWRG